MNISIPYTTVLLNLLAVVVLTYNCFLSHNLYFHGAWYWRILGFVNYMFLGANIVLLLFWITVFLS